SSTLPALPRGQGLPRYVRDVRTLPGMRHAFPARSGLFPGSHVRQLPHFRRADAARALRRAIALAGMETRNDLAADRSALLSVHGAAGLSLLTARLDLLRSLPFLR